MTTKEAIWTLENGAWWDSLGDDMSDADKNPLFDALDTAISALRAQQQTDANQPITLDELREMDGEPVWVVVLDFSAEWRILECVDTRSKEKTVLFRDGSHEPLTEYGKEWLAYRHKPKEA